MICGFILLIPRSLLYFIMIQLSFHRYSVIELYPKLAKIDFTKIV
ncbi:hypothetical protein HMPREF1410_01200 [Helicobacter pylori GAM249T]|nr:hypothetical protein HMPREF1410_01200 [Helicobacter pylori GAM249T]